MPTDLRSGPGGHTDKCERDGTGCAGCRRIGDSHPAGTPPDLPRTTKEGGVTDQGKTSSAHPKKAKTSAQPTKKAKTSVQPAKKARTSAQPKRNSSGKAKKSSKGRPPRTNLSEARQPEEPVSGTTKLTPEVAQTILAYIEAGAWDYIAAEMAGVSARTVREWIRRGEGKDPDRPPTPDLEKFARDWRTAKAKARGVREMQVADSRPGYWLERTARSEPGRPGWGAPLPGSEDEETASSPAPEPTAEELQDFFDALLVAGVINLPACANADCSCALHAKGDSGAA